jgi:Flp pilus assembly protein TadG
MTRPIQGALRGLLRTFRERSRCGAITIEFALVLPLLCTLIFGTIELGWIFYQDHTVNFATRLGCRYAAVGHTDAQTRTLIQDYCYNYGITSLNISIKTYAPLTGNITSGGTTGLSATTRLRGEDIEVEVTHNIMFLSFIKSFFVAAGVTRIRCASQFVIEQTSTVY